MHLTSVDTQEGHAKNIIIELQRQLDAGEMTEIYSVSLGPGGTVQINYSGSIHNLAVAAAHLNAEFIKHNLNA